MEKADGLMYAVARRAGRVPEAPTEFEDELRMVRVDMSEMQNEGAINRLIGSPRGYIGSEEGGQLTEALRREPSSVVLLDEVEKAHESVYDVLLQLLGEGRLTDGLGRSTPETG